MNLVVEPSWTLLDDHVHELQYFEICEGVYVIKMLYNICLRLYVAFMCEGSLQHGPHRTYT